MSLMDIAMRVGVPLSDLEDLVRGQVTESVARRLGTPQLSLQEFISHGEAGSKVAHRLGMSMAAAEELAKTLGSQGVIGLVLGLLSSNGAGRQGAAAGS